MKMSNHRTTKFHLNEEHQNPQIDIVYNEIGDTFSYTTIIRNHQKILFQVSTKAHPTYTDAAREMFWTLNEFYMDEVWPVRFEQPEGNVNGLLNDLEIWTSHLSMVFRYVWRRILPLDTVLDDYNVPASIDKKTKDYFVDYYIQSPKRYIPELEDDELDLDHPQQGDLFAQNEINDKKVHNIS